jgi:hypothetical protein
MRHRVSRVIEELLGTDTPVSSTSLAKAAGVSRQAAHKQLARLVKEGALEVSGKARASRYQRTEGSVLPLRRRLEVASAGSLFRLSARLLLDGVNAGAVSLDFTGVQDVGEEFLDELFVVWAPKHPRVKLRLEHLPSRFAPLLIGLAKKLNAEKAQAPG